MLIDPQARHGCRSQIGTSVVRWTTLTSQLVEMILRTDWLCHTEPMLGHHTNPHLPPPSPLNPTLDGSLWCKYLNGFPLCFNHSRDLNPFRAMRCIGYAVSPDTRCCGVARLGETTASIAQHSRLQNQARGNGRGEIRVAEPIRAALLAGRQVPSNQQLIFSGHHGI